MVNPYSPLYLTALTVIANILIHLWLIVPTSLHGKEISMANKDIYKGKNLLLDEIIDSIMLTEKRPEFLNLIRQVESGGKYRPEKGIVDFPFGNPEARAKTTTAAGVYQFTEDSVNTAKNRAKNIGFDSGFINLIPNDPTQWTDDEADVMLLANMYASVVPKGKTTYMGLEGKEGLIDSLLSNVLGDEIDKPSLYDLYYTVHHTAPDEETKKRAKKIFK